MNDTMRLEVRPEVLAFIDEVRARLGDLPAEDRDELTEGLAADLSDLVEEQGPEVLGDPAAYAAELRAAAGLAEDPARRPRRTASERITSWLDASRATWDDVVRRPALTGAWDLLVALRPAWWVLRAWVAVGLALSVLHRGRDIAVIPEPGDSALLGLVVLVVAVVGSVQIGRGRLWPGQEGDRRRAGGRLLLVGLNLLALLLLPVMLDKQVTESQAERWYGVAWQDVERTPGLRVDGHEVGNVFAYDSSGKPLTGVQLFDEKGRPLGVDPAVEASYLTDSGPVTAYPWLNGSQQLWNVFPLPVREQRGTRRATDAWASTTPPVIPEAPMLEVPPVALPTTAASEAKPRSHGAGRTAGKAGKTGEQGRSGGRGR